MIKAITGSNLRRDSQKDGDQQAPTRTGLTAVSVYLTRVGLPGTRIIPELSFKRAVLSQSWSRSKREISKAGKIDEHIDAAGTDNMESFNRRIAELEESHKKEKKETARCRETVQELKEQFILTKQ